MHRPAGKLDSTILYYIIALDNFLEIYFSGTFKIKLQYEKNTRRKCRTKKCSKAAAAKIRLQELQ